MLNNCYIDFEFSGIAEAKVKLVSCVTYDPKNKQLCKFWLFKDLKEQKLLATYLKTFNHIIAYSAIAECRSFITLGLEPLDWKWTDLFLEYRMITNHNDVLQWGKQLVNGTVRTVRKPKPKWERTDADKAMGFKATHSLAEATYKLTGEIRDTQHKNEMRDLIISYPESFTKKERADIVNYNAEDVLFLPRIRKEIEKHVRNKLEPSSRGKKGGVDMAEYRKEARLRGRYAAHTAWMETRGYALNVEATKNFSKQVGSIIYDTQKEINELFPDVHPFKWNRLDSRYSWDQIKTKKWIEKNHDVEKWQKTDGKHISLALDAWEKFYQFKHDYPKDSFGAQMVRFLKLKQSLYGFSANNESSSRKNFWDHVGSDGRVRPYMNIFGAQSSRSQPGATGFMFLKPAWMRALVQPAHGKFMAGIDYGSQEFLIAALQSGDQAMIDAYLSGDVYLAFGKLSGQIPKNGTKEKFKMQRDLCKSTVLGISYLMTKYGLAIKLTNDSGREWSEDEAQDQIDMFYDAFPQLREQQERIEEEYGNEMDFIKLPCGWICWGDNENLRSVTNVPVQGAGASIMRKAVDLNYERGGAPVIKTLHDALYIEGTVGKESDILILRDAMIEAFVFYFPKFENVVRKVKLDPFAWSPNYKKDSKIVLGKLGQRWEVPVSNLYIDERAIADYEKFSPYFEKPEIDLV